MHHALPVGIPDPVQCLGDDLADFPQPEFFVGFHMLCQRLAVHQFHDDESGMFVFIKVIDLNNARMHQPADRLGLLAKPVKQAFAFAGRISIPVEPLDGDFTLDRRVPALIDDTHASNTEFALNLVFADFMYW